MRPAVVGIGNRWRRDDGIGPRAIDALRPRIASLVDLISLGGEATDLLHTWAGRPEVWIVDAVRCGRRAGAIHRVDGLALAGPGTGPGAPAGSSTHSAGVAEAVALGRALDRLPDRLTVFGIEPGDIDHGEQLSPVVACAFGDLVDLVATSVELSGHLPSPPSR